MATTSPLETAPASVPVSAIYRVWCNTESRPVYTEDYVAEPPIGCPNDATHQIEEDSVVVVASEPAARATFRAITAASDTLTERISTVQRGLQASIADVSQRQQITPVPILNGADEVRMGMVRVGVCFGERSAPPPSHVLVRGAGRKSLQAGDVWVIVFDLDRNARIGSQACESSQGSVPQTISAVLTPQESAGSEYQVYPIEIYVSSSDRFTLECISIVGWATTKHRN